MTKITVKREATITSEGASATLTLAQLRELVEATKDWPDNARIKASGYDGQRDAYLAITVTEMS